ncbi:MAG: efflux RND transporter periplasmic adaptor subunit [Candidatus Limimorpha sp.]
MKSFTLSIVTFSVLSVLGSCQPKTTGKEKQDPQKSIPTVSVITAQSQDVEDESTFTSNIMANAKNNIVSQTAGRIKNILVDVGSRVGKGQLLAEMDDVNLVKLKLQLVNDSIEMGRLTELFKAGGVSQADFDLAKLKLDLSKKTYNNLLENTALRSPINGIVTARNYDKGDMYNMQLPIFVVEQIIPVKMLINISERQFSRVHAGMVFDISVEALPGETFKGKVNLIHPTIDAKTHTFQVEIVSNNTDSRLRPGMFARVTASFGSNRHIVVPDIAVVKQIGSGEHFVYVLNADNTVKYQKVELGKRLGNQYEILSGINEGDRVVTNGQARLKDGVAVTLTK